MVKFLPSCSPPPLVCCFAQLWSSPPEKVRKMRAMSQMHPDQWPAPLVRLFVSAPLIFWGGRMPSVFTHRELRILMLITEQFQAGAKPLEMHFSSFVLEKFPVDPM